MVKGRRVKLIDTGEYGNSLEAFKAPNGKYYSSEIAWTKVNRNKALYKQIYTDLQEILDINTSDPVPPVILKMISPYKERYDIIAEIFARNKTNIHESFRIKEIRNPWYQAKYIQAVIENGYNTIKKEFEQVAAAQHEQNIEPPTDISALGHKNHSKDVTKLVGGFSWT